MPVISMFYGLIVTMYYFDSKQHKPPHVHVRFGGSEAVFAIDNGEILEGSLPKAKVKLVDAWIEIHKDELLADWELAISGQRIFPIDPLK